MTYATSLDQGAQDTVRAPLHGILLGKSARMREVNELVQQLAKSNLAVLIVGETGTGKDIAARLLHKLSPRYGKPFIKVNCPAIPESILESELFGYERGAFTGARTSKPGRFELANHGTIFLDEIAETSYTVQSKLLQVLDGDAFMRIGGVTPIRTDVRIIAATNVSLEDAVRQGLMREDIFYRLSEVVIRMPSLRERPEDITLLCEHFNYNFSRKVGKEHKPLPPSVLARLQELDWPGNVRELAAHVKRYVATGDLEALFQEDRREQAEDIVLAVPEAGAPVEVAPAERPEKRFMSLKEATRRSIEATERALIEEALRHTFWNRRKAAKLLNISYSSLLRRIEAYHIGKSEA